jgi:hypothetical protein
MSSARTVLASKTRPSVSDPVPGGTPNAKVDPVAKQRGAKVEKEHTTSQAVAEDIATDHLAEDPQYYEKLDIMEHSSLATLKAKTAGWSSWTQRLTKQPPTSALVGVKPGMTTETLTAHLPPTRSTVAAGPLGMSSAAHVAAGHADNPAALHIAHLENHINNARDHQLNWPAGPLQHAYHSATRRFGDDHPVTLNAQATMYESMLHPDMARALRAQTHAHLQQLRSSKQGAVVDHQQVTGADARERGDEVHPPLLRNPMQGTPNADEYENGYSYAQALGVAGLNSVTADDVMRWKQAPTAWRDGLAEAAKGLGNARVGGWVKGAALPAFVGPMIGLGVGSALGGSFGGLAGKEYFDSLKLEDNAAFALRAVGGLVNEPPVNGSEAELRQMATIDRPRGIAEAAGAVTGLAGGAVLGSVAGTLGQMGMERMGPARKQARWQVPVAGAGVAALATAGLGQVAGAARIPEATVTGLRQLKAKTEDWLGGMDVRDALDQYVTTGSDAVKLHIGPVDITTVRRAHIPGAQGIPYNASDDLHYKEFASSPLSAYKVRLEEFHNNYHWKHPSGGDVDRTLAMLNTAADGTAQPTDPVAGMAALRAHYADPGVTGLQTHSYPGTHLDKSLAGVAQDLAQHPGGTPLQRPHFEDSMVKVWRLAKEETESAAAAGRAPMGPHEFDQHVRAHHPEVWGHKQIGDFEMGRAVPTAAEGYGMLPDNLLGPINQYNGVMDSVHSAIPSEALTATGAGLLAAPLLAYLGRRASPHASPALRTA